eukprot:g4377.t1
MMSGAAAAASQSLLDKVSYKETDAEDGENLAEYLSSTLAHPSLSKPRAFVSLEMFLATCGLEEVETLNEFSPSGSCMFSSVAHQLFKKLASEQSRNCFVLRHLACDAVEMNPQLYADFLLVPNARTRSQSGAGGAAVNVPSYVRTMRRAECDGDAVMLQALSDVLQAKIIVIWWEDSARKVSLVNARVPRSLPSQPKISNTRAKAENLIHALIIATNDIEDKAFDSVKASLPELKRHVARASTVFLSELIRAGLLKLLSRWLRPRLSLDPDGQSTVTRPDIHLRRSIICDIIFKIRPHITRKDIRNSAGLSRALFSLMRSEEEEDISSCADLIVSKWMATDMSPTDVISRAAQEGRAEVKPEIVSMAKARTLDAVKKSEQAQAEMRQMRINSLKKAKFDAADTVKKYLTTFYKNGQISKMQFKRTAKFLTEEFMHSLSASEKFRRAGSADEIHDLVRNLLPKLAEDAERHAAIISKC